LNNLTLATLSLLLLATPSGAGQTSANRAYEVVHGWPELPDGIMLGGVAGVGVDSEETVWIFQRGGRQWSEPMPADPIAAPTVVAFNGITGKVEAAWGARRFVMPHGLTIDGQDNIWLTDVGLHQVFKFSRRGELLLTLGQAGVAGADSKHFNQPTDVAVLPDGSFYVSDGYRNTRIAKFAPDGRFLFEWGKPGKGMGQLNLPHGLAVDRDGLVYVADRENDRIQIFNPQGHYLRQWKSPAMGRPYALTLLSGGQAAVVDGGEQPRKGADRSGIAIVDRDGAVAERFSRFGNYDGQLQQGHDIASDTRGNIYAVDIGGERVQKFARAR
jgi:peptidylamidoglycolate lyase